MSKNYYKPGSWNVICDVCGFKLKSHQVKKRWDGMIVCSEDWEPRHIGDFIKAPKPATPVPFTRPEPADTFVSTSYIAATTGVQENYRVGQESLILGDSVCAEYPVGLVSTATTLFTGLTGSTYIQRQTSLATPSESIALQRARYEAMLPADKLYLSYVILQLGLNNLWPTETEASVTAEYQALVDLISISSPDARIYGSAMTPSNAFWVALYGAGVGAAIAIKRTAINANIAGTGTIPITGLYGSITAHNTTLDDGSGNLAATYDDFSDGIHPDNAGRTVMVTAWYDKLILDGTLNSIGRPTGR